MQFLQLVRVMTMRNCLYLNIGLLIQLILVKGSALPLTALRSEHRCYQPGLNFVDLTCGQNERIRILDSFYGAGECKIDTMQSNDCKSFTNQFESFCNDRKQCQIEFLKIFLPKCQEYSSYLVVRYECVPGDLKNSLIKHLLNQ